MVLEAIRTWPSKLVYTIEGMPRHPMVKVHFASTPNQGMARALFLFDWIVTPRCRGTDVACYQEKAMSSTTACRAELKVTGIRWRTPICGFLRFSVKIFGFLRKSAVFCENLRSPNAWISKRRGESAKISGFLRKSAFWALSVAWVPSPESAPWAWRGTEHILCPHHSSPWRFWSPCCPIFHCRVQTPAPKMN